MTKKQKHPAFILRCTLKGHTDLVYRMALSPDGRILASPSLDKTVRLWDIEKGTHIRTLKGHKRPVICVAWSPDGRLLASGSGYDDRIIIIWHSDTGKIYKVFQGHKDIINSLSWHPKGHVLASGSSDNTIRIWNIETGKELHVFKKHSKRIESNEFSPDGKWLCSGSWDETLRIWDFNSKKEIQVLKGGAMIGAVAWSPDGKNIVSGLLDRTVRIWNPKLGEKTNILEGHTAEVISASFFANGRLLGSLGRNGRIIVWRTDIWTEVANIEKICTADSHSNIAFHTSFPIMAVGSIIKNEINIWELDCDLLLDKVPVEPTIHYINAKAVLVGESGVGKSGLGIRLAEGKFRETKSTHGAQFWQLPVPEGTIVSISSQKINTEFTLWDFAGQPEYRLVHQLFLDDTDVALLLFDCSDSIDPFRGVAYWAKVLKKHAPSHAIKLLVSARVDVSPVTVTKQEIHKFLGEYGLDEHFSTSACTNKGVQVLFSYILKHIPWNRLPKTSTPKLFQLIRELLLELKEAKRLLIPLDEIKKDVEQRFKERKVKDAEISTVISLLQARGFIFKIESYHKTTTVLMKPEILNQYASSIIQAARNNPLGFGAVTERKVLTAMLPFSGFERLCPENERIVLEATVELLIRHDLCFREMGFIVFPSQINVTRPNPPLKHPRTEVAYLFSGSIETIYASIVVRLGNTNYFRREDQWKYAVEFSRNSTRLGFSMHQVEEGTGELEIYFYPEIIDFDRVTFIHFITDHLRAKGIDIKEKIKLYCSNLECNKEIKDSEAIEKRIEKGSLDIPCQYCGTMVMIPRSIEERYEKDHKLVKKQEELKETATERTKKEVKDFKFDQNQYSKENDKLIHILHLSDIHFENEDQAYRYRLSIGVDLKNELNIHKLEYLIISGDIATYSKEDEYKAGFEFVNGLVKRFGLDANRVIIVPGNHDLNWDDSEDAYLFVSKNKLTDPIDDDRTILAGDIGALVRDDLSYGKRFTNFSTHFYKKVSIGIEYPIDYKKQAIITSRPDDKMLFLALNSSWQIDHHFKKRSGINADALASALEQILDKKYDNYLKIAVWHHPVTGKEMMDDSFIEQLHVHGFKICMHGHIHEAIERFHKYDDKRGIWIIGAGTFGAPVKEQAAGIPLQYNLLSYDSEKKKVTVYTRKKEKIDGAWSADARWGNKNDPKSFYTFPV